MAGEVTKAIPQKELWSGGRSPFSTSYGKMMMWFFLISDALTFGGLLTSLGFMKHKYQDIWPVSEDVFFHFPFTHEHLPLLYVAFMTFILIVSSVTMVLAVEAGHRMDKSGVIKWMFWTVIGGFIFVGSQVWEWDTFIKGNETHSTAYLQHNGEMAWLVLAENGENGLAEIDYHRFDEDDALYQQYKSPAYDENWTKQHLPAGMKLEDCFEYPEVDKYAGRSLVHHAAMHGDGHSEEGHGDDSHGDEHAEGGHADDHGHKDPAYYTGKDGNLALAVANHYLSSGKAYLEYAKKDVDAEGNEVTSKVKAVGQEAIKKLANAEYVMGANLRVNEYGKNLYADFFFFITGFHGFHVFSGVIINLIILIGVLMGIYHRRGHYEMVEKVGLYWHFVDLVWVFVFTFFYLV